jgi:23S rRNA (adenine2503-C2)-methyltransferase
MAALSDHDLDSLAALLCRQEFLPSHSPRLLKHFYDHAGRVDFQHLKIGNKLQAWMEENLPLRQSRITARQDSQDGTVKLLLGFDGGGAVESVLMPAYRSDRAAGCLSSQIGCVMGCDFCASTKNGLERNLTAGEIIEQFLHLKEIATITGRRLSTIVFMGMGEPLLNLDQVIPAIERISRPFMGHLGGRQITVSTVGVVAGIHELAAACLGVHLALSLHAADDQTRSRLIPANQKWPISNILDAARDFEQQTNRYVTIEYCLLEQVNDHPHDARRLADLLGDFRAHVNLIPYNSIGAGRSGAVYRPSSPERIGEFLKVLVDCGVVVHLRRSRGDDINAACGQLRAG